MNQSTLEQYLRLDTDSIDLQQDQVQGRPITRRRCSVIFYLIRHRYRSHKISCWFKVKLPSAESDKSPFPLMDSVKSPDAGTLYSVPSIQIETTVCSSPSGSKSLASTFPAKVVPFGAAIASSLALVVFSCASCRVTRIFTSAEYVPPFPSSID